MTSSDDEKVMRAAGFFGRVGFGKRPAIVVIDLQKSHTDTRSPFGSQNVKEVARRTKVLLDVARKKKVPIIYVTTAYRKDGKDCGLVGRKHTMALKYETEETQWVKIDNEVKPEKDDILIVKKVPDAFFGTPLDYLLRNLGIDTLIVTGCSTSGCVRATVDHSASIGYRTIIPEECVGDRAKGSHKHNLYDMNAKSADVLPLKEVLTYIQSLSVAPSGFPR